MARKTSAKPPPPIGEVLRGRRVEVLKKGLREMARLLDIAPAHLTDIEKGRRSPSEGLLKRISELYGIAEPELRAGWSKADSVVEEVANQDAMTAEKVPEFLRTARKLNSEQWDRLIGQARQMASDKGGKSEK
ncbi:MAG: helix-turn-helix transcriptional regulator [Phycisphaerae bacterium]|nr:helix-turn-helix transcriptional regulator [Phycisphaerae bacterium]